MPADGLLVSYEWTETMIYLVLEDTISQETVLGHFSRMLRIHYHQTTWYVSCKLINHYSIRQSNSQLSSTMLHNYQIFKCHCKRVTCSNLSNNNHPKLSYYIDHWCCVLKSARAWHMNFNLSKCAKTVSRTSTITQFFLNEIELLKQSITS